MLAITHELARAVGRIAKPHPACAVTIEHREQDAEQLWRVTLDDGVETVAIYEVDDESGAARLLVR